MSRPTEPEKDAAYEQGWRDSLHAYSSPSRVDWPVRYYYFQGWDACAKYRWTDPANNGVAPDPNYRVPRTAD